jgi:hypothetical protein
MSPEITNRLKDLYYQLDGAINKATGMLLTHPDRDTAWELIATINDIRHEIDKIEEEEDGE